MQQYIYILFNPSHKTLLKIGRTSRTPEERARELSANTGVAQPYIVAYESVVSDSIAAEAIIHEVLDAFRVNQSREFFELPLKDAVQVVSNVCQQFSGDGDSIDFEDEVTTHRGVDYLSLAIDHLHGNETVFQDFGQAQTLLKNAIALGETKAYPYLADIYLWGLGTPRRPSEAIRLLQEGGQKYEVDCFLQLWKIYTGQHFNAYAEEGIERSTSAKHHQNADIAFGLYLKAQLSKNNVIDPDNAMTYLQWSLRESFAHPGNILIGSHANEMLSVVGEATKDTLNEMRRFRLAGIQIEKAFHSQTHEALRLSLLLQLEKESNSAGHDLSKFYKNYLGEFHEDDLLYGFSRLPKEAQTARTKIFSIHLIKTREIKFDIFENQIASESKDISCASQAKSEEKSFFAKITGNLRKKLS